MNLKLAAISSSRQLGDGCRLLKRQVFYSIVADHLERVMKAPKSDHSGINTAILFEPDGYVPDKRGVLGRHSAGRGFLKAFLAGIDPKLPIYCYTPKAQSAKMLSAIVEKAEPQSLMHWVRGSALQKLQTPGALYLPGPSLTEHARMRERIGANAYSLVGVTHTTATQRVMDQLTSLLIAPVMPWDAIICTSHAVRSMVTNVIELLRSITLRHV